MKLSESELERNEKKDKSFDELTNVGMNLKQVRIEVNTSLRVEKVGECGEMMELGSGEEDSFKRDNGKRKDKSECS